MFEKKICKSKEGQKRNQVIASMTSPFNEGPMLKRLGIGPTNPERQNTANLLHISKYTVSTKPNQPYSALSIPFWILDTLLQRFIRYAGFHPANLQKAPHRNLRARPCRAQYTAPTPNNVDEHGILGSKYYISTQTKNMLISSSPHPISRKLVEPCLIKS